MSLRGLMVLQLMGCVACAARAPSAIPAAETTAPRPNKPAPSEAQQALERARAARRDVESRHLDLNTLGADASQQQRIQALTEWVFQREHDNAKIAESYEAALASATPAEQLQIRRELGELYYAWFETKLESTLSLFEDAKSPAAANVGALREALVFRFASDLEQARDRFVSCLMLASQRGIKDANSSQCEARIRAIDALKPKPVERNRELEDWQFTRVTTPERRRSAPAQPKPCVLQGNAETWSSIELFTAESGVDSQLSLEDFDVVTLELPREPGARAKLSIEYPFRAAGYVETAALLETSQRLDLLPPHLWLARGTSVSAFGPANGQVNISRDSPKTTPVVALRVPCSDLTLSHQHPRAEAEPQGESSQLSGSIPLFAAPNGKSLGQLQSDLRVNVRVLARQAGWVRVTSADAGPSFGAAAHEFDAWVPERFSPPGERGWDLAIAPATERAPTHVTRSPLPLRLAPLPDAPVVASLVAGVPLLAGVEQAGMRRIRFNAAHGNNEGRDFWVATADLEKAAAPPTAPAGAGAASR